MENGHTPNRRTLFGGLAALFAAGTTALAQDKKDDPTKGVPKAVKEAAEKMEKDATWLHVEKVTEADPGGKDRVAYEFDGTDGKDRQYTLTVTADGKVVESETVLKKAANVPAKVLKAVQDKKEAWKEFAPTETHKILRGKDLNDPKEKVDTFFDMKGSVGKKDRDFHVQVAEDGTIIEYTVEIPAKMVEKRVTEDAMKKIKGREKFTYDVVFELVEGEKVIGYNFEGKGPKGRPRMLFVSADGKQLELVGDH
jgi:hypothetical protein